MKERRRFILILLGVGLLVGVLGLVVRPDPEPEYGGKKLSEWVMQYSVHHYDQNYILRTNEEAGAAIAHIGTNALPYLLKWIKYEKPTWKTKSYDLVNAGVERLHAHYELIDKKELRAYGAEIAFRALGREAIPELVRILSDPKATPERAERAAYALGCGGQDGLASLLPVLTNRIEKAQRDLPDSKVESALHIGR